MSCNGLDSGQSFKNRTPYWLKRQASTWGWSGVLGIAQKSHSGVRQWKHRVFLLRPYLRGNGSWPVELRDQKVWLGTRDDYTVFHIRWFALVKSSYVPRPRQLSDFSTKGDGASDLCKSRCIDSCCVGKLRGKLRGENADVVRIFGGNDDGGISDV